MREWNQVADIPQIGDYVGGLSSSQFESITAQYQFCQSIKLRLYFPFGLNLIGLSDIRYQLQNVIKLSRLIKNANFVVQLIVCLLIMFMMVKLLIAQLQINNKFYMNQLIHSSRRSITSHYKHHPPYRIQTSQQLNNLKTNIKNTFDTDNKIFNEVKQLTSKVNPSYSQRLNQICVKYSICSISRKKRTSSEDINVDFIAKKYVKSRSIENKKVVGKNQLKKTVAVMSKRYQIPKEQQFFKLQCQKLKQMIKKKSPKKQAHQKSHPYLTLYQKSQGQVMNSLNNFNKASFQVMQSYPIDDQCDEWIKNQKKMKDVYNTVKKLRAKTAKYRQRPKRQDVNQFFAI